MNFDRGTSAAMSHAFNATDDRVNTRSSRASETLNTSANTTKRMSRSRIDISNSKELKLQELAMISLSPILRSIHHWWLQRAERHYLICADVEQQRAREAQMNVAYYQKRAALARSARN